MIKHTFKTNSNNLTKRVAKHIESFDPKINYITEQGSFGIEITAEFENEVDRDIFINKLSNSLKLSENGIFLS